MIRLQGSDSEDGMSEGEEALLRYRRATAGLPEGVDEDGYVAVVRSAGLLEGMGRTFHVDGSSVALFRFEGKVHGIDNACTHEDGPLGEGRMDEGGVVKCPYHGWRYRITDGACLTQAARPVKTHRVKEVDSVVWVAGSTGQTSTRRGGEHDDGLLMAEDEV